MYHEHIFRQTIKKSNNMKNAIIHQKTFLKNPLIRAQIKIETYPSTKCSVHQDILLIQCDLSRHIASSAA